MAWSFIDHITDYISRPRLGQKKHPTLWPSEASCIASNEHGEDVLVGKCRRSTYFRYLLDCFSFYDEKYSMYQSMVTQIKQEYIQPDTYLRWIWKQGCLYEDYCLDIAKESGVYIGDQLQVFEPDANISGKIDIVVLNPETGLYSIVEVKSVYGFGANYVLGTPASRRKGILGEPRESHLMQLALYDYFYAKSHENFGPSLLVYGARDTGRYAEYKVTVEEDPDTGKNHICYEGQSPITTQKVTTPITIDSIVEQYKWIANSVDSGHIPDRDYELVYSEERIDTLYERGELNKKDTEQYAKRKKQIEEGKARVVKPVVKGDWQCDKCSFRNTCYNKDNTPKQF